MGIPLSVVFFVPDNGFLHPNTDMPRKGNGINIKANDPILAAAEALPLGIHSSEGVLFFFGGHLRKQR